jgi:hypothetical protein
MPSVIFTELNAAGHAGNLAMSRARLVRRRISRAGKEYCLMRLVKSTVITNFTYFGFNILVVVSASKLGVKKMRNIVCQ